MRPHQERFGWLGLVMVLASLLLIHASQTWAEEGGAVDADPTILRWGADSEGGAPFVFHDPADPEKITGFEVDIIQAVATKLGKRAVFVQNEWDGLVPGLNRGNYDVIINGLEITDERKEKIHFSNPYYVTAQQIVTRKEIEGIATMDDLVGKAVGTLKFSLAHRMLEQHGGIDIRSYQGESQAYADLANGRLDAVLLDAPIALYHGVTNPKLKLVGGPIGNMSYGIGIRKSDTELLKAVNAAIESLRKEGKLREIYEHWALWNPLMAQTFNDFGSSPYTPVKYQAFLRSKGLEPSFKETAVQYMGFIPMLAKGAMVTVELSLISMGLAVVVGLIVTLIQLYAPQPFSFLARAYIEVIRGTPLLIQLFFIFYGLPKFGIKLDPIYAAILGLGLNYSAYEAENYRAGIQSIPREQMEAALALGMSRWSALRHIIVPQAMRLVIPPVTNDFISLLKDSSLVSVITMVELTKVYGQLANTYYDYFGIGLMVAAMYFLIGLPFVRLARLAERHFAIP